MDPPQGDVVVTCPVCRRGYKILQQATVAFCSVACVDADHRPATPLPLAPLLPWAARRGYCPEPVRSVATVSSPYRFPRLMPGSIGQVAEPAQNPVGYAGTRQNMQPEARAAGGERRRKGRSMAPWHTILIADDDAQVRLLVHVTIASDAYFVLEATDGDEAWEILQTCRPDVVLLDVHMPGRDGVALTRAIRADPLLAPTRVILLTGAGTPEHVAAGYAAGADHYLLKPFSPLQLLATIAACVGATEESTAWLTVASRPAVV